MELIFTSRAVPRGGELCICYTGDKEECKKWNITE